MRLMKKILVYLFAVSLLLTGFTFAAEDEILITVEGEPVSVSGTAAILDQDSGSVMASTALFSEALDTAVDYDADTGELSLTRGNSSIYMTIDAASVRVNSRTTVLDTAPKLYEDVPYVPLRFTAESFGYEITWYGAEKRVDIRQAKQYELGITREKMQELYGEPTGTRASEKGYTWQVYDQNLKNYYLIGLDGDRVSAYYVCSDSWKLPFGVQYGMRLNACNTIMNSLGYSASSGTGYMTFSSDQDALTVYYSSGGDNPIYAALYEDAAYLTRCEITPAVLESMAQTLADLGNVMRVRDGLDPLLPNEKIASVAARHADDMAQNDYFSHLNAEGKDKTGRMLDAGFSDFYISEAICKAFSDSFEVFASFYGNASYREILSANFASFDSGFAYNPDSEGILYGVQLFFAEKD